MKETVTPFSIALKYGLIAGLVLIIYTMILLFADLDTNKIFQYLSYTFILAGIIISYNDYKRQNNGFMSYGQGLGIGTLLSVIAGGISGFFMFVYIKFIDNSILEKIREAQIAEFEKKNMSDEQIEQAMSMVEKFTGPTAILIFSVLFCLFFGFVFSLIVSAVMKKTQVELNTLDAG